MNSVLPFPTPASPQRPSWTILNTRPQSDLDHGVPVGCPLTLALQKAGLQVQSVPLTQVHQVPYELKTPITQFDWLFFTSPNGVKGFFDAYPRDKVSTLPPIAVVGPGTADAVQAYGASVAFCPKTQFTAQAAAEAWLELSEDEPPGKWVLWPCGERHRPELATTLRAAGCCIDPMVVYQTEALCPTTPFPADVQVITLSSPFSVEALHQWQPTLPDGVRIACFGSSTLKMVQQLYPQLSPGDRLLLPTENTLVALAQCIIDAWQRTACAVA
jgi:uroporphyrinogen-III synthase